MSYLINKSALRKELSALPLQEYDPEYFVEKAIQIVKGGMTANAGDQATAPL